MLTEKGGKGDVKIGGNQREWGAKNWPDREREQWEEEKQWVGMKT